MGLCGVLHLLANGGVSSGRVAPSGRFGDATCSELQPSPVASSVASCTPQTDKHNGWYG